MIQSTPPEQVRTNQAMARERTDYAFERTQMAATRTFFALLRTGLAIAGGGTVVTTVLASGWPDWVIGLLSAIFIVAGFTITIGGLQRYHQMIQRLSIAEDFEPVPIKLTIWITVILQCALVGVLILFLLK